jgi:hypothetical protein
MTLMSKVATSWSHCFKLPLRRFVPTGLYHSSLTRRLDVRYLVGLEDVYVCKYIHTVRSLITVHRLWSKRLKPRAIL